MILTKWTSQPFMLDRTLNYEMSIDPAGSTTWEFYKRQLEIIGKPTGLWLSDEKEFGWRAWCLQEGFSLKRLTVRTDFQIIDPNMVCLINDIDSFDQFHHRFGYQNLMSLWAMSNVLIDWNRVKKEYSGIIISPYRWDKRFDTSWYYSWDCASACIWDLNVLRPIEQIEWKKGDLSND